MSNSATVEQIVSVSAVPSGQVKRSILSYQVGQRKLGWWSKVVSYDTKTAVVARTALLTTGRATSERVQHGSFTTYLLDARLHVLGGWTEEGGQGHVTLEAFGESSSATWARWVVEEAIRPDPAVFTGT